jgi:diguanylate cyclase (GGDEF)-like protein
MKRIADKALTSFFLNLVLIMLGFIAAIYLGIFLNNRQALEQELQNRARSIVEAIVITRKWNANHGGVYVLKTPGMISNPYLEDPDLETADGRIYTKKNPALMVREISEIVAQEGSFQFNVTSLNPINPANKPDPFEGEALAAFETGIPELFTREKQNSSTYFRYMAPLIVEDACLACHARQGYRIGDIRGGISVRFNIDAIAAAHSRNLAVLISLVLISILALFLIISRLMNLLRGRLKRAEQKLQQIAITDELTGLKNRRYLLERLHAELVRMGRNGRPLACIIFDLDHFKQVNDTFGHQAGDEALREIASHVQEQCRANDILSRFGGEEFVVLLPDTDPAGAREIAERLRRTILSCRINLADGQVLTLSASFGVAGLAKAPRNIDQAEVDLLNRADGALYRAKAGGRNRVEVNV